LAYKLRQTMGKRDGAYILAGRIELDEGYFSTEVPVTERDKPLKRGRGSAIQQIVGGKRKLQK
jgi:hypothetical protein